MYSDLVWLEMYITALFGPIHETCPTYGANIDMSPRYILDVDAFDAEGKNNDTVIDILNDDIFFSLILWRSLHYFFGLTLLST